MGNHVIVLRLVASYITFQLIQRDYRELIVSIFRDIMAHPSPSRQLMPMHPTGIGNPMYFNMVLGRRIELLLCG